MTKKEFKRLFEEYRNRHCEADNERQRLYVELLEAKIKNDALVSAITSKDTEIFIYNGDTYKLSELSLTKTADSVDRLNVELIKCDTVVSYDGGLVGTIQEAIKNVGNTLKVLFYGDKEK